MLNSISGRRNSETRRQIYQVSERPDLLAKAPEVRAKLRRGKVGEVDAAIAIAESEGVCPTGCPKCKRPRT